VQSVEGGYGATVGETGPEARGDIQNGRTHAPARAACSRGRSRLMTVPGIGPISATAITAPSAYRLSIFEEV
jgi:hypothetical protein